jgi:hypothetical protein
MNWKPVVSAVLCLLFTRSAVAGDFPSKNGVMIGMSRGEVIAIMGQPQGVMRRGSCETLGFAKGVVVLTDGQVTSVEILTDAQYEEKKRKLAEIERLRQEEEARAAAAVKNSGGGRRQPSPRTHPTPPPTPPVPSMPPPAPQSWTEQQNDAAIHAVFPNAKIEGSGWLSANDVHLLVDQAREVPDVLLPKIDRITFTTNREARLPDGSRAGGRAHEYGFEMCYDGMKRGTFFHEVIGHIYFRHLQRNGAPGILEEFEAIRGPGPIVYQIDILTSSERDSFFRWPDGLLGPTNGCFTVYGTTNPGEDIAESIRVLLVFRDYMRNYLNPSGARYDKRFVEKLEFLNKWGFLKPVTYLNIKEKAGISQ